MTVPNTPRLCPACLLNVGYWTHLHGFCPTCAALDREAGVVDRAGHDGTSRRAGESFAPALDTTAGSRFSSLPVTGGETLSR